MTFLAVCHYSGDVRIWQAKLPGRWIILVSYMIVFLINVTVWVVGYHFLDRDVISSFRRLFLNCASAYLILTVPAIIIDHQYNTINRHYLDKRRTDAYVATNADALASFSRSADARIKAQMGPDLVSLANDPEFYEALRNGKFYKLNFDEPFQIFSRAVMFGYKIEPHSGPGRPIFTVVRFPRELALALRFKLVADER